MPSVRCGWRAPFFRRERRFYSTSVVAALLLLLFLSSTAGDSLGVGGGSFFGGGTVHRSEGVSQERSTDLWSDSMFDEFRGLYSQYMQECPVYFYRRTCGDKSNGEVQVIVPMGSWKLESLLSEERVTGFMLFLRFLLETFWRKVVKNYAAEKKLVVFLDLQDVSMTQMLFMWGGLSRMFDTAKYTLKKCPGKSWSRTYIVNAPFGMGKLLDLAFSFVPFRRKDVFVLRSNDGEEANRMRAEVGERCLWRGYGGKSKLGLDRSEMQKAIRRFVETGEPEAAHVVTQPGSRSVGSSFPELKPSDSPSSPVAVLSPGQAADASSGMRQPSETDASSRMRDDRTVEGTVNLRATGKSLNREVTGGAVYETGEAKIPSSDGLV